MKVAFTEAFNKDKKIRSFYPLGLASLAAYVSADDVETLIAKDETDVLNFEPDLVGIYAVSPYYPQAIALAKNIKKHRNCIVILGGPHISSLPESLDDAFDLAVVGEGEVPLRQLIEYFSKHECIEEDILSIPRVVVNISGRLRFGPEGSFLKACEIPIPMRKWDGVGSSGHWLSASRGCPYECRFCSSSVIWQRNFRVMPASRVAEEVVFLVKEFGMDYCLFMDDLFSCSVKRVREVDEEIRKRITTKLAYTVTARMDNMSDALLQALCRMGVDYIHFGLESASGQVLSYLKKTSVTIEESKNILKKAADMGLKTIGSFIIGSPIEDEEDLKATCDFIERSLTDRTLAGFAFSPLVPFPGTDIWGHCLKKGVFDLKTVNWHYFDIDFDSFSPDRYYLLCHKISKNRFMYYFERLKNLAWPQEK